MPNSEKTFSKLTSLLSAIFFFSGFAALIYQVAWQRLLTVNYGVGSVSITLIVSIYMFGMGVGALVGGYISERIKNKILFYFFVELLIGCFGLISLPFLDFLGRNTAGSSYLLSFMYMFLFLSIPTLLMGITLPLLTKIFNRLVQSFLDTVSLLYFVNTIGAALGAIFASYIIISLWGLDTALYCAVAINFILAILIFLSKYFPQVENATAIPAAAENSQNVVLGKVAYLLVFITGFLAIGYEIAWFRVIGILVKTSPYAFSSILSVYLMGIALGSYGMSKYLHKNQGTDKKSLFFLLQFLIGLYVLVIFTGYYYSTKHTFLAAFTRESFLINLHPLFKIPSLDSAKLFLKESYALLDVFLWPLVFVFIPTVLMGASFPLVSLLALSQDNREGKTVGTVYFFNILGNVLGGVITGFVLLPFLGTESTLLTFSMAGIVFILFVSSFTGRQLSVLRRAIIMFALVVTAIAFFPSQGQLYETMHISPGDEFESYFEEGRDGIIMTYKHQDKVWNYINGLIHGIRPSSATFYWSMETISYTPKSENVLIIGYGTGSTTEAILKVNDLNKLTLIELNSVLIKNLRKMDTFQDMLDNNKLNLIIDDGRRFLLRTDEKYDLILIDPLRTTEAYSNNLYSQQFFNLISQHLNKGGVFMLWMDEFKVLPKTVLSVFKYARMYDSMYIASNEPLVQSEDRRAGYFSSFTEDEQKNMMQWVGRESKNVADEKDIRTSVADYPVNQDWKPFSEYYLGLKLRETVLN